MEILSVILFIASVACYTISQLLNHSKIGLTGKNTWSFFGHDSHLRKYKNIGGPDQVYIIDRAPNNWYYRLFRIPYRERFLGSATIFVFLTDGYHLMQFFFKLFLCASIALYKPLFIWWIDAVGLWVLFGIVFTLGYRIFSR